MRHTTQQQPSDPGADLAWVVALLTGPDGRPRVIHPQGVSPLPDPTRALVLCGTHRLNGADVTWAFGYVPADAPSPQVVFLTRHGWRSHAAAVRRLTTTTWAAQLAGRWSRVRAV